MSTLKSEYLSSTDTLIELVSEPFHSSGSFLLKVTSDYRKQFRFDCILEATKEFKKQLKIHR
jgi:hypothetical protein